MDKDGVIRELAQELDGLGLSAWYDEFTLSVGDSLRRATSTPSLATCRYGVVVVSRSFFAKNWPQYGLDGLVTPEMADGAKLILPVWHDITHNEVITSSPHPRRQGGAEDRRPHLAGDRGANRRRCQRVAVLRFQRPVAGPLRASRGRRGQTQTTLTPGVLLTARNVSMSAPSDVTTAAGCGADSNASATQASTTDTCNIARN